MHRDTDLIFLFSFYCKPNEVKNGLASSKNKKRYRIVFEASKMSFLPEKWLELANLKHVHCTSSSENYIRLDKNVSLYCTTGYKPISTNFDFQ